MNQYPVYELVLDDVRPFSINSAYYARTHTLTRECRMWRQTIFRELRKRKNQEQIIAFKKTFDHLKHGIAIYYSFGVAEWNFFKKDGSISIKSMDLSNTEKLLQDLLFDPKYAERKELNNVALDDKYIIKLSSEKIPLQEWRTKIRLHLIDLPTRGSDETKYSEEINGM